MSLGHLQIIWLQTEIKPKLDDWGGPGFMKFEDRDLNLLPPEMSEGEPIL